MDQDRARRIAEAIELFDKQQYQEAFSAFTEMYHASRSAGDKQEIFQLLEEVFYRPNAAELEKNYTGNLSLLQAYPYFWGRALRSFEALRFQLFPVSEGLYCCYDREKDRFGDIYDGDTPRQMRYFFERLDEPIRATDEDNCYNLTFLHDNVRSSEDFAGDNHIYLLYATPEPLERLMLACDLAPLLRQQKFVFLLGKKNWKRYPIDFQKTFGVDYAERSPAPVRVEEVKRICFWYKHAYSGTELSLGVLGAVNEIQMYSAMVFHTDSTVDGKPMYDLPEFRGLLNRPEEICTVEQIESLLRTRRCDIRLEGLLDYLAWLRQQRPAPHRYTVKELFCGYFLFRYEQRHINPRVVPMLLFDLHVWNTSVYNAVVSAFPYRTVLTSVREPIMTFGRSYLYGLIGWSKFQTQYILGSDYVHAQFLPPELQECYFGFRFEDLKTKPEAVCRALCRHLNVPFAEQMLETEAPLADRTGQVTRGFDQAPLHRDISAVLTEFDQLRLKLFYDPILRYYGYPCFPFEEYPLSEEVVRELLRYPFRFERLNKHYLPDSAPPEETLHEWIQEILQGAWRKQAICPRLIPPEETAHV